MLAGIGVVDKWIALRSVDELEVLRARLAVDGLGLGGHDGGGKTIRTPTLSAHIVLPKLEIRTRGRRYAC